jgi:tetratricopeptide (TPR) repeat protein
MTERSQHKWMDAAATLQSVAETQGDEALAASARFHAADSLLAAGQVELGTGQLEQLLADFDDGETAAAEWADDALASLIRAATQQKQHARVVALAERFESDLPDSPLREDIERLRASALVSAGDYQAAIPLLERVAAGADQGPGKHRAIAELAISLAHAGRLVDAKPVLQSLVDVRPAQELLLPTIHQIAEAAYQAGDADYATELFRRLADPANPEEYVSKGLSGLAWSQLENQDLAGSDEAFAQLMERYPDDARAAEATLARAKILERQNQPDPALALLHRVIDEYPTSPQAGPAMLFAAQLHERLKQFQAAIDLYEALLERPGDEDKHDAAWYGLGWARRESGETASALESFQKIHDAHSGSPHWPTATYLLAEGALEAKQYDRAEALLGELLATELDADLAAKALYLRGGVAAAAERWDDAAAFMRRLGESTPGHALAPAAWYWIAEAAYRQNRLEQAAAQFVELEDLLQDRDEPWVAMIPLRRAQIFAREDQWSDALDVASRILTDYPDFNQPYEVHYLVGRCLAARGDFNQAREAYQAAIAAAEGVQTETAAMAQWMIGETYMHQQQFEPAYREYLRGEILYAAYPQWRARSLLQAGKCAERLGKWSEAISLYERLLADFPNEPVARDASERLTAAQRRAQANTQ